MKIGKFKIELQYDMQCDICGEYRSNIHFYNKLSVKPTVKELRKEGWEIIQNKLKDGTVIDLQICPNCSRNNSCNTIHTQKQGEISWKTKKCTPSRK